MYYNVNWRKAIEDAQNYSIIQSQIGEESKLLQEILYMKKLLKFCNDSKFQAIYNSYMLFPFEITQDNKAELKKNIKEKKSKLKTIRTLKETYKELYNNILYGFLYNVMESNNESWCKQFYCPDELLCN